MDRVLDAHGDLRDGTAILRSQSCRNYALQIGRKLTGRDDLAHERKGEGPVRQDADDALQPVVTPNHHLDFVARIYPVRGTARPDGTGSLC